VILKDVYGYKKDENGKKVIKGFPDGCDVCDSDDEWQCKEGCLWYDNYWKYDEVRKFVHLYQIHKAGCDIMRLGKLSWNDWKKLSIAGKIIESRE